MKKLLALVLALVMTLSLCVVSSNAKFDDAADITYTEAADVMQAVGVFVGDGTGNFYPKQNLTRAQAAKVIAYLDLGESVAEALPAVQMFSDVPATHWAAKYIAYCADAEIVAGVGNGKFDPEAQVTGYQFAKMLLVVLGYDVEIEKLTGMNWSISTAKLVKENKLSKGFKGSFNDGLTREGAAQIAFRAIQAHPVYTYTGYGLSLDQNNQLVTNSNGKAVKVTVDDEFNMNKDSLYADLYDGKLSTHDDDDKLQNPATKWIYKNAKIGTYTEEPVLTYTTSWTWAQAKEDLAEAGVEIDTVANNVTVPVVVYENGDDGKTYLPTAPSGAPDTPNMKAAIADNTKQGGNGVVTKFYANGDDYLNRVTEAKYQLAEVTSVTKDLASTKLVNEAALKLKLLRADNDATTYEASDKNGALGFSSVYADAKVGDIFLVAVNENPAPQAAADKAVKSIVAPVVKEGKLTSVGTNSVKFEGETYNKAKLAGTFNANATGNVKLYCDEFGYAYGTGDVDTNSKLVVVTDAYQSLEKGKLVSMIDVVYADGTTGSLKVKDYTDYTIGQAGVYEEGNDNIYTLTEVTTKHTDQTTMDNYYKVLTDTTPIKVGAVKMPGTTLKFADNIKTIFVYYKDSTDPSKGIKTVVAEGVKEVKPASGKKIEVYFTVNAKGEINALFVGQKPANTITGTDGIVFIYKNTTTVPYDAFDLERNKIKVMDYAAYVNGEEIEEFHVVNGGAKSCLFFELENDIDVENGYLLNTPYVNDETIGVATGTVKSSDIYESKNALTVENTADPTKNVDVTVSGAKFVDVDSDDNYVVEDFSGLIEDLNSADNGGSSGTASVSVIYNVKTMTALYVYVGKIQ